MPTCEVCFSATGNAYVKVTTPEPVDLSDGTVVEDLVDQAERKLDATLCYHCVRKVDLGEFEAYDAKGRLHEMIEQVD